MPVTRRGFTKPFNRKDADDEKRHRKELRRMGIDPTKWDPPPAELPKPTSKASRPDMYPHLARGINSVMGHPHHPDYPAGRMSTDVNNQPDDRVATDGVADPSRASKAKRHGRTARQRRTD